MASVMQHGSEAQIGRLVPPLAQGHEIAAFALTEPGSGSDAGADALKVGMDAAAFAEDGKPATEIRARSPKPKPLPPPETAITQPAPEPAPAPPPPVVEAKPDASLSAPVTPPHMDATRLRNPLPVYPSISRRRREEGTVLLDLLVLADGSVSEVSIHTSSGFPRLDKAALELVRLSFLLPAAISLTVTPALASYLLPRARFLKHEGDAFLLQRAIANLLANAVEFSPVGGTVEVDITHTRRTVDIRVRDHGPGIPPYAEGKVFEKFGRQRNPKFATYTVNNGLKIEAAPGTPVRAVFQGTVLFAQWFKGYGNLIILDHGNRVFSLYGNLKQSSVAVGDRIATGQPIAGVAESEEAEGGYLYFEIRRNGKPIDPMPLLPKR